jgi:hypothetical protein
MKNTLQFANTFRNNFLFFVAAFAMSMGAFTLNSCVKSTKTEMAVSPSPTPIIAERGDANEPAECEILSMEATTALASSGSNTMVETLNFGAITGADHYEIEARDVSGAVLYNQNTPTVAQQTFTRPLSFEAITWDVKVFSTPEQEEFSCSKPSKLSGGGISIIIAERVTTTNGTTGPIYTPTCNSLQPLVDFYTKNAGNGIALSPATYNTKLVSCFSYPFGPTKPISVTQAQLLSEMEAKYGVGATLPIHVFIIDPAANTCNFYDPNQGTYSVSFLKKQLYASKFSVPMISNATLPTAIKNMNRSLNDALFAAYPNYINSNLMKQYTVAFVDLN